MKYESYVCNNCGKYIDSFYTCINCYNTIMNNLILPHKYNLGDKVYYLNIYAREVQEYYIKGIVTDIAINDYFRTHKEIPFNKDKTLFYIGKSIGQSSGAISVSYNEIYQTFQECLEANVLTLADLNIKTIANALYKEIQDKLKEDYIKDKSSLGKYLNNIDSKQPVLNLLLNNENEDSNSIKIDKSVKINLKCLERDKSFTEKQNEITDLLEQLLKSDLAINMNLTGLNTQLFDGYILNNWLYGIRTKNDIIKEYNNEKEINSNA